MAYSNNRQTRNDTQELYSNNKQARNDTQELFTKEDMQKVGTVALAAVGGLCAVDIVRYAAHDEKEGEYNSYTWNVLKTIADGWQSSENDLKFAMNKLGLEEAVPFMNTLTQAVQGLDKKPLS